MSEITLLCKKCNKIFPSGFALEGNSSVTFVGCQVQCNFCNAIQPMPDSSFRSTVEGMINMVKSSDTPLEEAKRLLQELHRAHEDRSTDPSPFLQKYQRWLPNTPEKIAAYVTIVSAIITLLNSNNPSEIKYETIIKEYNQTIIIEHK